MNMNSIENAIEVQGLGKSFGPIRALDGVSMSAPRGQVFGLVGPNGSGKSTLIKTICGLLGPDSGSVKVMGLDAMRERYAIRRRLGYMPQTVSLYDDLSPWENLRFFGRAFGTSDLKERIQRSLEFVQLWDRRDDPLHTFSGGMRQRSSLACALLHEPELLVLDEPTAGVDPTLRHTFWSHFRELCDRGGTIFLSTNQMDEAMHCDRVAVIRDGRILVTEAPEQIRSLGRASIEITLDDGRRTFEVANYESELPQLLSAWGLESRVRSIEVKRQSLEDVILGMIGQEQK